MLGPLPSVEPVPAFLEPMGDDAERAEDPLLFVVYLGDAHPRHYGSGQFELVQYRGA